MKLLEKPPTDRDFTTRSVAQSVPTAKHRLAVNILHLTCIVVLLGAAFRAHAAPPVAAKSVSQADSKDAPAIDPGSIDALNKMGVYLRTQKSFQVVANITTDDVLDDGQTIQFSSKADLVAARPDRFRVEVTDDDGHRFFFYDGKNFTIYGQVVNYYATVPAPPTIAKLADDLSDKYGIELPLSDLFQWGTDPDALHRIKGAIDIGPSSVNGVTCEHYAFHEKDIDWQIWIELGDFPLPLKLAIRTLTDDAKPQYTETLTWNLAPSYSDDAFTFAPPPGVARIPLAELKAKATEKK
ncbi:DUF2092 domain-containing protein [Granulicella sp. L46]|uniref:DUF2092 domain-containing protein n=1 Tax=Granulicella sp. L46 TaxID=1641865 RepID=UPI00131D152E|nr:DUF2092 domain-containing protein [Granulicella sp. L46]